MDNEAKLLDYEEHFSTPNQHIAPGWKRLINLLLDRIIIYISLLFLLYAIGINNIESAGNGKSLYIMIAISIVYIFSYWILCEYYFGKTPAKFITGTKVLTKKGGKPRFFQIVGRTLCRLIPFDQFSFIRDKPIGWHDSISNTIVVNNTYFKSEIYKGDIVE